MAKKYELLSPVGDFASLHAAIESGADAAYFGLKEFNMRDNAKNFTIKDLDKIKKICSEKKVKMYLTLNTIIYDSEIARLKKVIKKIKGKVNAVICWDLSVIELCRKYKIPFHISTQASVSNSESAKFYKKLGAERIVLARELSLKQIKKISKIIEIECFAHGAMCVSVSGRCFTSQFLNPCGNLSANRGRCSHPCRRAYRIIDEDNNELVVQNSRVMSAKDLCTLPFIERMKKAGIKSFKIEGRNRNPEYVSAVTKVYRKALDRKLSKREIAESLEELKKVYNRGFSSGFYIRMPTADDFSFSENGEQTEKKEFIGRITKYWPKAESAALKLFHGKIKRGDEVYIIGKDSGIKRVRIESMQKHNKSISEAEKGEEIGIKVPKCFCGDEVYKIIENKK